MIKQIDIDGQILLIQEDRQYDYKIIQLNDAWTVLLRDDGCRIESMYISEKPTNDPIGKREWETLWEYKRCDAPGCQAIVKLIMEPEISSKSVRQVAPQKIQENQNE